MAESRDDLFSQVDRENLPRTEQDMYDSLQMGRDAPRVPDDRVDRGWISTDIRDQLRWLEGTAIDFGGSKPVQPRTAMSADNLANRIVIAKLQGLKGKTGPDFNNLGCALLWLDDDASRNRARKALTEAQSLLKGDAERSQAVAANLSLLDSAVVWMKFQGRSP